MIDHWADLLQLRADGRRILRWIVRQGVVMCCEPTEQERARDILLPVFRALEDVNVVLKADKLIVAKAQMLAEAGVQRLDEGPQIQRHQAQDGGATMI